jgi:dihydropyrimidinase
MSATNAGASSEPLLIRGGRIITTTENRVADVLVEGERITAIGEDLPAGQARELDARGLLVLPGCVDPHVHLDTDFGGAKTVDDFTNGTAAAAIGGTTTLINFAMQWPGQTLAQALDAWKRQIEEHPPIVDVGLHMAITDLDYAGSFDELDAITRGGIPSYKVFTAYKGSAMLSDDDLLRVMESAAANNALVMVHAENGDIVDLLQRRALEQGHTEPRWHAATRPALAEAEATSRVIDIAQLAGASLYVVHVSCAASLERIANARAKGWRVWGETCPQYLFTDESDLERPDFEGAKYVFSPPPRTPADQEALWEGLADGVLSVVATDHVPFTFARDKQLGRDDFSAIPNGAPGIENRLQLMHHFGVRAGRFDLHRMVDLLSTTPARIFGLHPRKGTIAVGADADLVLFDPQRRHTICAATQVSHSDYSLMEGVEVVGSPTLVTVRGRIVVEDGRVVGRLGDGAYVSRAPFDPAAADAPGQPLAVDG